MRHERNAFGVRAHLGLVLLTTLVLAACAESARRLAPAATGRPDSDFITLYPGRYSGKEQGRLNQWLREQQSLNARGPIDVQALIGGRLPPDTPGLGPKIDVTEEWVRYHNAKYDPDNRVLHDAAYARSLGYADILAYPTIAAHDDTILGPPRRDALDRLLAVDLNHSITNLRPIHPGDTLYIVVDSREVLDLTPPAGSTYRFLCIESRASIYNQRGENVQKAIFRVTRGLRVLREGLAPANPGFADTWDAPDWRRRPARRYTEADWERIRAIWSAEKRQDAALRYWEDVRIGEEPTPTLDGPILASVAPKSPWGMGAGGSRTLRREILDPVIRATMLHDPSSGIYRFAKRDDYIPRYPGEKEAAPAEAAAAAPAAAVSSPTPAAAPAGGMTSADIHREVDGRAILINYMGRDYALRHVHNWMGDHGWVANIRWSIMDPRAHALYGKQAPVNPRAERYLWRVPHMAGRFVDAHGLTQDVALVRSYVYDKYVRNGEFLVDLVWWVETLDGDIWEEGGATVRLPSREAAAIATR